MQAKDLKHRILVLVVMLMLAFVGWESRHSIMGVARSLALPKVEPPPAGTIRFAAIGDYGSGSYTERDVALVIDSWKPDFVITLGDNCYTEGGADAIDGTIGRYYHSYISPYQGSFGPGAMANRFFPIPGHRDWDHALLQPYLDYFTLPGNERYYDVGRGPVHLFMLDTDEREPDGATPTSIQGRWLEQALARSAAPWKLVLAHHAPYTSHQVEDIERMRWPFKDWGADAVLSGYYHVYERLLVDGLPYFVNGAGGSWVSNFGAIDAHSQFRYNEDYGAMLVDASETRIKFRFVNRGGKIIDEYLLTKDRAGANPTGVPEGSGATPR
ncbi:MAG: metallophosphoesterase family protein [Gammaproteobacteria bacterium]